MEILAALLAVFFTLGFIGSIVCLLLSLFVKKLKIKRKMIMKSILICFIGFIVSSIIGVNCSQSSKTEEASKQEVEEQQTEEASSEEETKLTGWQTEGDNTYYYDNEGQVKTGWIEVEDKKYFANNDGIIQKGWIEDNATKYYLNDDGTLATDIEKDGYKIDANGVATQVATEEPEVTTDNSTSTQSSSSSSQSGSNSTQSSSNTKQSSSSSSKSSGSSSSGGKTTYEPATGDITVYWTPNGKSYHNTNSCPRLSKSKIIKSGSPSQCPKTDPCDSCIK